MNCQKIKKLINPYIDQALDRETVQQVEEHLKSCSACREEHLNLKQVVSALNSISLQPSKSEFLFRGFLSVWSVQRPQQH
jgi:predicted anti-sigma-YlaC factor YlaD